MVLNSEGKKPTVFFHPGLPKTATTFLQQQAFPKLNDVRFTKKHHFKYHESIIQQSEHEKFLFSFERDVTMEQSLAKFSGEYPDAGIILSFRRHDKWIASK